MPTIILIAELVIQYRSVGEEALRLQVGLHSRSVVLHVAIYASQGVPSHGSAVALPVRIIIVGGVADAGVGGEGYVALVVGLRAQDGIEGTSLATERGEGDAIETLPHEMGHTVELRLQRLQLAHAAATATPHAEGGKQQAIYHGAQFHTAKIAFYSEFLTTMR